MSQGGGQDHEKHHPDNAAPAAAVSSRAEAGPSMDVGMGTNGMMDMPMMKEHMHKMRDHMQKMRSAKSDAERSKMTSEQMSMMMDHMDMMMKMMDHKGHGN